jgi:pyrroline-5-carboxylate reductase
MTRSLPHIAFIGTGNMGGAIVSGLVGSEQQAAGIRATTRTAASAQALGAHGIDAKALEADPNANLWAVAEADMIVLGVKPYQILEVLTEIAGQAKAGATMVSVAGGITIASMEERWPGAVVRCMPNTPSQVGKGVAGVSRGSRVSDDQVADVEALFATVGDVITIDESSLNALSSLSGSGPAYVYFFMERFMDIAHEYGFTPAQARTMVTGTFGGALDLLEATQKDPGQLRQEVTSPKGSTYEALRVFEEADIAAIIRKATQAAITRSDEMASE